MNPLKLLLPNSSSWRLVAFRREIGIDPSNLFPVRVKPSILGSMKPMSEGNRPIRLFSARAIYVREDMLKSDFGTGPDKLFPLKSNISSVEILPKHSGILPTNLFLLRKIETREESFAIEWGIDPER